MNRWFYLLSGGLAAALLSGACSEDSGDSGAVDASVAHDGGSVDASPVDSGAVDSEPVDAGGPFGSDLHTKPARCGLSDYAWLPPSDVGAVKTWQPHNFATLTPAAMKALLSQAGLKELPKALTHPVANFELRYTTQDKGKVVEATAVVSVPTDMGVDEAPVLLWLHGTSGWMDDCAPSGDLSGVGMAALLAGFGYIVVAPDFLGMLGFGDKSPAGTIHPYLINEPTAIASIDALRATAAQLAKEAEFPAPDPDKLGLIGASQGGHAVLATDRLLPHYAPGWPHKAAVALVAPIDLHTVSKDAVGDTVKLDGRSSLLAAIFASMHKWHESKVPLTDVFTDKAPESVASNVYKWMSGGCDVAGKIKDLSEIDELYSGALIKALQDDKVADPWKCYLAENSVSTTSVKRLRDVPILMTYAEKDDLALPSVEKPAFADLCKQGYRLQWRECKGLGHAEGAAFVLPEALAWIGARLKGDKLDSAGLCKVQAPASCM